MSSHILGHPLKERIANGFGRAASYYQQQANLQKEVADRLIASLEPWRDIIPPGPILEVGCGTGFVTEGLMQLYPGREKEITDLSAKMEDFCKNRFQGAQHTLFYPLDGEEVDPEKKKYALTVCGFAAQWFRDPALTLGRLLEAIRGGGLMLASFPGTQSFPEWKECCRELELPYTGNEMPDTEEMVIKLSTGPAQVDYYEDTINRSFESAAHFFRHMKKLGAGTSKRGESLSPAQLQKLIEHWDGKTTGNIKVQYHIVFLAVKKDHTE